MSALRFLVVEGNAPNARAALAAAGAHVSGDLYTKTLQYLAPGCHVDVVRPTDADAALPAGTEIAGYDGVAWTGSALNVYNQTPEVTRQIELARAVFEAGVPFFGSCWALQVAVVAAGGVVRLNPKGREFGVARKIALNEAGKAHPMFAGKPAVYDAVAIHSDEVETLPPGSTVLAGNGMSAVQAAIVPFAKGAFWGVQYHPEYDMREIGCLCLRYGEALVKPGYFKDLDALKAYAAMTAEVTADPGRKDLCFLLGVDADVLDKDVRLIEARNWIAQAVLPNVTR